MQLMGRTTGRRDALFGLEHADAFTQIWATSRPLRYLREKDLCGIVGVPWVYLLAIYNHAPCVSVFLGSSQDLVESIVEQSEGVADCSLISLEEAMDWEQKNWEDIYRQFENPEQKGSGPSGT
jgi:hypothetical protein